VLGEPVGRLRVISVVLGLAGAAVLLGFADGLPLPRSGGDWLGLAAGLLFALSVTLVRKGATTSGLEQTLMSFAVAALLSLILLAVTSSGAAIGPAVLAWAALAALAWLVPVTWLLLWGARFLDPGRVSLLLLLEVAVAATSAALLAGEPFAGREALGCLLILAAGALEGVAEIRPGHRRAASLPPHAPATVSDTCRPDD
jgi:drug/metabolite transporter (DMT)-like permease